MMIIYVIILLSLTVVAVSAQEYQYVPFPDNNAVWSEVYWKPISEPCPRWVYHKKALFNEDSVINGISYHKLFSSNKSIISKENSECVGMIREDSTKKIWFRYNTENIWPNTNENGEYLLYDFGLNEGDTIDCYSAYLQRQGVDYLLLDSVRYFNINNSQRKIFYFNIPWEIWIEGIGKIQGIIFPSGDLPTNGMDNDLICFHQNDTLLFFSEDYDGCVPSFVLNDVVLLPNPATGESVYFEGLDFEKLELYDNIGNLILSIDISGLDKYVLDVFGFTPGIYFYQLKKQGLVPTGGKLIIP
ncbi:MAG: T9SS type A sorting domain-containing protein [Prolixibacteraceae bacterium]|jgi:hypothetical protein|nr:T9SS type A sorting domain-containing protein [Prolixibacteraceae bacterium]